MEKPTEEKPPLIMLIDDTPEDIYINNRIIEKYGNGNSVIKFSMGTEAMEFLKTNKDHPDAIPDIILIDIHMPQMNAFEFLDEYDQLPLELKMKSKVFVLSSTFNAADIQKMKANLHVKHFFEKPLTKESLNEIFTLFNEA